MIDTTGLCLRKDTPGEVGPVKALPEGSSLPHGDIALFIHGFNVSPCCADNSYSEFAKLWSTAISAPLPFHIIRVYWPGDRPTKIGSILGYMADVGIGKECGVRLAAYLAASLPTETRLHVVAHSLGNRIAVEMIKGLMQASPPRAVENYVLMASAVPVDKVDTGGPLAAAASHPRHSRVLFSSHDHVLHLLFPVGEFLSGDDPHATATGRFGGPASAYGDTQLFNYCHSQYWHEKDSAAAAAGAFGAAIANTTPFTIVDVNILQPPNVLAVHSTPVNTLGESTTCPPSKPFKCGFF